LILSNVVKIVAPPKRRWRSLQHSQVPYPYFRGSSSKGRRVGERRLKGGEERGFHLLKSYGNRKNKG